MSKYNTKSGFTESASLTDKHCGSVSLSFTSGATISFPVSDDSEYMMSGLYEPDSSFDQWL